MRAEKSSPVKDLVTCLDALGDSLGSGDLDALGPLAQRLDELGQLLPRHAQRLTREDLLALKQKAERQMHLLDAARDGAKSAVRRVELIRRASAELATYDREGQGRTLRFQPSNLEQRA